ncbi:MAG TPA: hypothetical protein VHL57_08835 [Flavobacteriales bacterium]|jgi:hypothetical protein|nr:hypothetical protein [Flavobacteriales bacterium]
MPFRSALLEQLWPIAFATAVLCYGLKPAPPVLPGSQRCTAPRSGAPRAPQASPDLVGDFVITANGNLQWVIGGVVNPTLTLVRGRTYVFDLTAITNEHPFVINAAAGHPFAPLLSGPAFAQLLTFTPTSAMPATIYYHCEVHYGSMTGRIDLVAPPCPGDQNADAQVNVADFGLFANAYGTACTGCRADLNADGQVNVADFGLFANAYGAVCVP